jgi:hypothetical protein
MTEQSTERLTILKHAIKAKLAAFDYETLTMGFIMIEDIAKETGLENLSHNEFAEAAKALNSNVFDMYPRHPDDFSSTSYLWVTPSPNSKVPTGPGVAPEKFWVLRDPTGTMSMRVKEGLLIFSLPGYAAGHAISKGIGDFNVEPFEWQQFVSAPNNHYSHVVLDYFNEQEQMNVIPVAA